MKSNSKQENSNLKIIVRPQTAEEEFSWLIELSQWMKSLTKWNYSLVLPEKLKIRQYFINKEILPDNQELHRILAEEYDCDFYTTGLAKIEKEIPKIREIFPILSIYKDVWNFKIFDQYKILLTRYGPGGSYDEEKGIVQMMVRKDGSFKRQNPLHTIIHEIVHISIEKNIVQKFRLSHWEKEGLVDKICVLLFGEVIPEYQVQSQVNEEILKIVNADNLHILPDVIDRFKNG